ncbi:protein maelstrom-like [Watersipora subatra]|uniref:protein maelstrom-like n=1 Tax=Watersipora subatra TaxID=2589382 RepID=UPI00355C81AA
MHASQMATSNFKKKITFPYNEYTNYIEVPCLTPPRDITEELFHFIDVQSLCKTSDGRYMPVEIAVIEFSLKDGIKKAYHQFLKPGEIQTGMRYECMSQSEDTHKIPVEGHPDANSSYLSVQNSLENFLNHSGELSYYPPVFALREEWKKVHFTLDFIKQNSQLGRRAANIKVYELESLLVGLVNHSGKGGPTKSAANDVLTSTTHDYHQGLKCNYHEDLECKHCSLLWVRKFCYAIADALKKLYDYEVKPRTHLPTVKDPQFVVAHEDEQSWVPPKPTIQPNPTFKTPANLPKTESVLARVAQPAPIFRPAGAANLDYAKNKNKSSDMRFQQHGARHPAPYLVAAFGSRPNVPSTNYSSSPPHHVAVDLPTSSSSKNINLAVNREATWVPNSRSGASWRRRKTPASTPRATPHATPLPTPKHSPPREGAYFPEDMVRRRDTGPPPGFGVRYPNPQSSFTGLPPPGFEQKTRVEQELQFAPNSSSSGGRGGAMFSTDLNASVLHLRRGRGIFLRK